MRYLQFRITRTVIILIIPNTIAVFKICFFSLTLTRHIITVGQTMGTICVIRRKCSYLEVTATTPVKGKKPPRTVWCYKEKNSRSIILSNKTLVGKTKIKMRNAVICLSRQCEIRSKHVRFIRFRRTSEIQNNIILNRYRLRRTHDVCDK